jgi:hypothetical protein
MAVYAKELTRARVLYEDHTLIAASASVNSGFIRLPAKTVTVTKVHTTGTYALSIAWSMDSTNTAFTTTPTMVDNTPQTLTALAPYAKFTITCTVTQFTVHQTTIMT